MARIKTTAMPSPNSRFAIFKVIVIANLAAVGFALQDALQTECAVGGKLSENKETCTSMKEVMVYDQARTIQNHLLENSTTSTNQGLPPISIPSNMAFHSLDYDPSERVLYYASAGSIYNIPLETLKPESLQFKNQKLYMRCVGIDWLTKDLYYVYTKYENGHDTGAMYASKISEFPRPNHRVVVKFVWEPAMLVVHPRKGYVFLSEKMGDYSSHLLRFDTSGGNKNTLDKVDLDNLGLFAIDFEKDRIYWFTEKRDFYKPTVCSVKHSDLDGNDVQKISLPDPKTPSAFTVYKNYVYYLKGREVWRFHKETGNNRSLVFVNDHWSQIHQMKVIDLLGLSNSTNL